MTSMPRRFKLPSQQPLTRSARPSASVAGPPDGGGTRPNFVARVLRFAAALAGEEHSYTQADIDNGARLYQSSCAGCHGPNGDMVPGIELLRGQFRRATSDTEIMRIIQAGIPGTTMVPACATVKLLGGIVVP